MFAAPTAPPQVVGSPGGADKNEPRKPGEYLTKMSRQIVSGVCSSKNMQDAAIQVRRTATKLTIYGSEPCYNILSYQLV